MNALSKGIKTSVKVDVRDFDRQVKKIERRINKLNNVTNQSNVAMSRLSNSLSKVDSSNKKVANSAKSIAKGYRDANSAVSVLTKNLRTLASTYLGVMGAKAVTGASDTITSAENRLNQLNGNNPKQTQQTMDKMYASAQGSRMAYADMVQNVSKSMTLAGDAFQDNIDNAIRFQEIMAKSYTLGGASAAEQHSSMYQMIQALGSGRLQGDELRSVREGAPLAYKAIEEFAQGVLNTEESLKDLASQGLITSELVVAAMMDAGAGIDEAFAKTDMTFAQAFTNMRNIALKSFEPVLQKLNDALNSKVGTAIINGIGTALYVVSRALLIVFNWIERIYNFVSSNWGTISKIIYMIGTALMVAVLPAVIKVFKATLISIAKTIVGLGQTIYLLGLYAAGWLAVHWVLALVLVVLAAIVVAVIWVADSFVDACGIIVGIISSTVGWFANIFIGVLNIAIQVLYDIFVYPFLSAIEWLLNATNGGFNGWAGGLLNLFGQVINGILEVVKVAAKAIDAISFGKFNLTGTVEGWQNKVSKWGTTSKAITLDKNAPTLDYISLGTAYGAGYDLGTKGGNWISNKLNGIKDMFSMDGLSNVLNPTATTGSGYDAAKALDDISDNTGKIADSMDLAQEDLEYYRRVADLEWKKEFTTANIVVKMDNTNTINNSGDLEGWAYSLRDMLEEELVSVANGVYA